MSVAPLICGPAYDGADPCIPPTGEERESLKSIKILTTEAKEKCQSQHLHNG